MKKLLLIVMVVAVLSGCTPVFKYGPGEILNTPSNTIIKVSSSTDKEGKVLYKVTIYGAELSNIVYKTYDPVFKPGDRVKLVVVNEEE